MRLSGLLALLVACCARGGLALRVTVVEEHHEALPHWIAAHDRGELRGNATHVHIDAHADDSALRWHRDLSVPSPDGAPRAVWPANARERAALVG